MIKSDNTFKSVWLLFKLLFSVSLFSCQITQKKNLQEDRVFKIIWSSPLLKKDLPLISYVSLKAPNQLRIDIIYPFKGVIGSLVLKEGEMTIQIPSEKIYYQGDFESQLIFPKLPPIPPNWLFALLTAKPLPDWVCTKASRTIKYCQIKNFSVKWFFKKKNLESFQLRDSFGQEIKAEIKWVSADTLKESVFSLPLKNYKKVDSLFFKKINSSP